MFIDFARIVLLQPARLVAQLDCETDAWQAQPGGGPGFGVDEVHLSVTQYIHAGAEVLTVKHARIPAGFQQDTIFMGKPKFLGNVNKTIINHHYSNITLYLVTFQVAKSNWHDLIAKLHSSANSRCFFFRDVAQHGSIVTINFQAISLGLENPQLLFRSST